MSLNEITLYDIMDIFSECFYKDRINFALLKIAVNPNNPELLELYKNHINKHNSMMVKPATENPCHNAGFDLFIPQDVVFDKKYTSKFIDMEIKTEMTFFNCGDIKTSLDSHRKESFKNCGYNIHPRSSISKTPLMLANHTGIVDSGYRGSLIGAFRWLRTDKASSYTLEKHTRLLQICHPSLCRILVTLVEENELSETERGDGGFGSTGIVGL